MLLQASKHKKMIWKNGGGITNEVARAPNNGQEEFDWRISLAQVTPPGGPFSFFPNIDRTLCIVSKHELDLILNNNNDDPIHLNQDTLPYSFPGELSINCQIKSESEPLTDLNVMTRRGKYRHSVERIKLQSGQEKSLNISNNDEEILFIIIGQGRVVTNDAVEMTDQDALRIDHHSSNIKHLTAVEDTQLYTIQLNPIR